eukprot:TRINITY_DN26449_c0_g1_i1.p1 TRINITY_DN26449_c0_g1~~TRINITY_DN26449_c0_g1_i1.p1  ORF type:complete len:1124 (+),score=234.01 TRINITY_DN26449_c0_g1_i1:153-3524(+)
MASPPSTLSIDGELALRSPKADVETPGLQGEGDCAAPPTQQLGFGRVIAGHAPLVRLMRARQPEMRRAVHAWLSRYTSDPAAATAELLALILTLADVQAYAIVDRDDLQDREPVDVVQDLVAAVAVAAAEKGADFSQHWFVSREKGAARARENYAAFWRELAATAPCQSLIAGLWPVLRDWVLALADCQFRSIRFASAIAGLQLVEGLCLQCRALREFCSTATVQVDDAQDHEAGGRNASLAEELDNAKRCAADLKAARDSLGVALLSRRGKDIDAGIRRNCLQALCRWVRVDGETFLDNKWTLYLHYGLHDRDPETRVASLTTLFELFGGDTAETLPTLRSLADQVRARVLARCHDVSPAVGAAAVRCVTAFAARNLLAEQDFDPVVDLVWDPDSQRRNEAAAFVSRFVFSENILDYSSRDRDMTGPMPCNASTALHSRRRVLMLLQFISEYAEGKHCLIDRLAAALWRRASCLEDWEVFVSMALPGSEHSLSGDDHVSIVHLMEATARLASHDVANSSGPESAHALAVLDRAARAMVARLSSLLSACQSEPVSMRRASALCRQLLRHCVSQQCSLGTRGLVSEPVGVATAEALKAAFLRQPDPEALEHLAESLAYLLDMSAGVRPILRDLASSLRGRFLELAPKLSSDVTTSGIVSDGTPSAADSLQAVATRLRILAKAFDVSMCDLSKFVAAVLGLLDDRATALVEGKTCPNVSPLLATTLLELLAILIMRHTVSFLQPKALLECTAHDVIDKNELLLAPTASSDLCSVAAALATADSNLYVRTAALATGFIVLSAWSTAFSDRCATAPAWNMPLDPELATAMQEQLGKLLIDANSVPADTGAFGPVPEPGDVAQPSAASQLFAAMLAALPRVGTDKDDAMSLPDTERVRFAVLASVMVASCRHPDVQDGTLPAMVLAQALSPREDLQNCAWVLLKRLRREVQAKPASGAEEVCASSGFFLVLLRAVRSVHQDAGTVVARDLSLRLLQHVGVGKLAPAMQGGLLTALRAGVETSLCPGVEPGLLEALIPWVTKHVVNDDLILELATWAEQQPGEEDERMRLGEAAGLAAFVNACRAVASRGGKAATAEATRVDRPAGKRGTPAGGGSGMRRIKGRKVSAA